MESGDGSYTALFKDDVRQLEELKCTIFFLTHPQDVKRKGISAIIGNAAHKAGRDEEIQRLQQEVKDENRGLHNAMKRSPNQKHTSNNAEPDERGAFSRKTPTLDLKEVEAFLVELVTSREPSRAHAIPDELANAPNPVQYLTSTCKRYKVPKNNIPQHMRAHIRHHLRDKYPPKIFKIYKPDPAGYPTQDAGFWETKQPEKKKIKSFFSYLESHLIRQSFILHMEVGDDLAKIDRNDRRTLGALKCTEFLVELTRKKT